MAKFQQAKKSICSRDSQAAPSHTFVCRDQLAESENSKSTHLVRSKFPAQCALMLWSNQRQIQLKRPCRLVWAEILG